MTWILGDWKLMFQIPDDFVGDMHVKRNFVVLSFAAYWSWVKVSVEMFISLFLRRFCFKGQCLQRLARNWELCASNAHPRSRAFSQCTRRKAIYEIYTCHCKPGPYRIKAGTNFYSLINSVPKNYNTKKRKTVNKKIRWWWNLNQITNKAWVSPI